MIGERVFFKCEGLRQVVFDPGSALDEIGPMAFYRSGLESFDVPSSLRRVCVGAFAACERLADLRLGDDVRELGWLCFWAAGVADPKLPPHMMREQLGLDQRDPRELRLPDELEEVGEDWFRDSEVEQLVVPGSVRVLGRSAFAGCERLREVVFESGSRLEIIRAACFSDCGLTKMLIPRGVRSIGPMAFYDCWRLSALAFEEDSALRSVGSMAFYDTRLGPEQLRYPNRVEESGEEDEL